MKGLAFLLLVAVWVCCGVEYGCSTRAPVSARFPLGAIGCLFTTRICGPGQECVDDRLFGTCQDRGDSKEFSEYPLDRETLEDLETQILVLIEDGFSWRDAYTQCMLQNILVHGQIQNFDKALCSSESAWAQNTEDDISNVLQKLYNYYASPSGRPTDLSSIDSAAALEYVPDLGSQKRDEFLKIHKYFDPSKSNWKRRVEENSENVPPTFQDYLVEREVENVLRDTNRDALDYDNLSDDDVTKLRIYLEALQEAARINGNSNDDYEEDSDYEEKGDSELDSEYPTSEEAENSNSIEMDGSEMPESETEGAFWSSPGVVYQTSPEEEGIWRDEEKPLPGVDLSILETNSPGNTLPAYPEQPEEVPAQPGIPKPGENVEEAANQIAENGLSPHYAKLLADLLQNDLDPSKLSNKDLNQLTKVIGTLLRDLTEEDESLKAEGEGVEDMDPGDNQRSQDEVLESPAQTQSQSSEDEPSGEGEEENTPVKKADTPMSYDVPSKGEEPEPATDKPADGQKTPAETLGVVDATFVYVTVDKDVSLEEGKKLVGSLETVLGIPPQSLTVTDVQDGRVTFRISPELLKIYNASSIAKVAGSKKGDIARLTGLNIVSAGIGSQDGEVKIEVLGDDGNSPKFFVLTFVLCGCIAGVLIAVVVIYLVKRHSRSKDKLAQLASEGIGAEASQDYQDLCRQRMQSKTSEKPEPLHAAGRIGSVTESQVRSPSSRSSTSSWSEEPVTSNMDISTGHIVLSYMEDHLKNKGRLDQEWEALGAYEADPCSTIVASDPSNTRKNRYADNLPYDHSRVVLADASNVSGSDYINASTITDHDPRNPAYISTQGPLPHTVADFWQMVWEQGSVVIVMLTKLTENGVAMCHRYWPEEGSDLYHIYEVHLVSEHIWCDDYLVRSFYLKNLQTNETRTVTQFHFLTWQDNKVPGSVKALLDFRRKVNKSYRGRSCPIVVHCSDGTGRSGTYTLIDMVLNRLAKGAKEIDIAATLEHIRDQRMGMVKTKEQFEFALAAVAEEVHAILKSLPQ